VGSECPGLQLFDQEVDLGLNDSHGRSAAWGGWREGVLGRCWRWWSWSLPPTRSLFCVAALETKCRSSPGEGGAASRKLEGYRPPFEREPTGGTESGRSAAEVRAIKRSAEDWGDGFRGAGQGPLSVPGQLIRYKTDRRHGLQRSGMASGSSAFGHARRCGYALEREPDRDHARNFVELPGREEMSVADPRREYGVSRPTGYRWIGTAKQGGRALKVLWTGAAVRSTISCHTGADRERLLLAFRAKHPSWRTKPQGEAGKRYSLTWRGLLQAQIPFLSNILSVY